MSAFEIKAELPEVETFDPIGNALVRPQHAAESAVISSEPVRNKAVGPVIAEGGYTLTVPGAEGMSAPFVEQEVSTKGRFNNGPLVQVVEDEPLNFPRKKGFLSKTVAATLAANICLMGGVFYFSGFFDDETVISSVGEERLASKQDSSILTGSTHQPTAEQASFIDNSKVERPLSGEGALQPRQVRTLRVRLGDGNKVTLTPNASPSVSLKRDEIVLPRARPDRPLRKVSSYQPSGSFLKELKALETGARTKPLTIVHIGDSHIAGDGLSEGIRDGLQARFGDAGRGAVIPAKAYPYTRAAGLRLTTSGAWDSANSLKVKSGPYGISGFRVASSSPSSTMTMTSTDGAFDWAEVTVLTGPSQGKVKIKAGGQEKIFNARSSTIGSKAVRLAAAGERMIVQPQGGGKTTVLNWATGKEKAGIRYINFGISSATAYLPRRWTPELVANDLKNLNPDLIVWGYGTNEGFNANLNMASYKKQIEQIYAMVEKASPEADWLFLGPASGLSRRGKAASYCNGYRVPVKLGAVRGAIKGFAEEKGHHYWDWAASMGGDCAVDQWARQSPKLAAGDRVHLTSKGYRKSANALVAYIEKLVDEPQLLASLNVEAN